MKKIIQILTISALPALAVAQNNVLRNPGFEYDPSGASQSFPGWTCYGPTYGPNTDTNVWSESGAGAHGGANYIQVSPDLTTYKITTSGLYQDYMAGPGATYSADGWVYAPSTSVLAGHNSGWIEITFRDANANVLALYRSSIVTNVASGGFPQNTWVDLLVTNQYDPNTCLLTNTVSTLVAPAGAYFVRCQVVVSGDGNASDGGLLYFDDLRLASVGGTPYSGWNLAWSDEFNGTTVDPSTWTYDIGTGTGPGQPGTGWGNNELEYYTSRTNNVYEAGGMLHIVARQESNYNGSGADYTSARLLSQGLVSQKYGRIEWSAKLPLGTGCWPALWLLGSDITTVSWPGCGEIDMMENRGSDPTIVQSSTHSGGNGGSDGYGDDGGVYQFISGEETNAAAGFHTYTMDWSTNAIMFYTDGHLLATVKNWSSSVGSYPVPFNQPFFFIMNLAIGGSYLGWPSESSVNSGTAFPVEMDVDYLRVYQQTNTAFVAVSSTPPQAPANNSVLVDFDSGDTNDNTASPTNGFYWNNVVAASTGGTAVPLNGGTQPISLVNAANASSGMTLAVTCTGWGAGAGASWGDYTGTYGYPSVLGDIPSTALRDCMTISGGATMTVTLAGLNPGSNYNVLIYGATVNATSGNHTDNGNAQSNTLTAGTSPSPLSVRFNAYYNSTAVGTWTNVTPNSSGQIALTITVPSGGSGGALNFLEVTPSTGGTGGNNPPAAPTGPNATAGNGQVALTWTASSGATSYNVKRSTTSGGETTITNVTGVNYTDTQVVNGTTYYYKVSATNAYGESANSTEVSATPTASSSNPPAAPTILTVTTNSGQVSLTWSTVATATSYNVKRSTTSGGETTITNVTVVNYTDTSVVNGTTYYYKVSAVNANGESANSAEVSATPPVPSSPPPSGGTTALMNFADAGSSYFVPSPDGNGNYWNNITSVANPGNSVAPLNGVSAPLALTNTAGTLSGWTLTVSNIGVGGFGDNFGGDATAGSGPFSANLTSVFPVTALEDGITIGNGGNPKVSVAFSGLTTSQTYSLLVFSAINNFNGNLQTNTLVVGTSASPNPVIFNAKNNTTTLTEWDNITPSAGGKIIFNVGCAGEGALSCVELVQNTPAAVGSIARGAMIGKTLTLNWTANANIALQSTTNLTPPVVWTDVPNTTGQGSATITTTNTRMFFRLGQP